MNVLVVDDYAINRKLLRVQLEGEGHAVVEAADGVQALHTIECEPIDAVISDILMPDMDGFRLCLEVRKSDKVGGLPFILYTSTYDSPSDRELAKTVGADDYIIKPAPAGVILAALNKASQRTRRTRRWEIPEQHETYVLKQYSEALVRKLSEKNTELQDALDSLRLAHGEILELNRDLDGHVKERTAQLEAANGQLRQANEELDAFSFSVSHDLRAPLRHITNAAGVLEELLEGKLDAEARTYLNMVSTSAKTMAQLINDLLAFSRMARAEMQTIGVDLDNLVDQAIGSLQSEVRSRNIVWKRARLPTAQADPAMLSQVFVNLIANAVKYTRPRDPAVIEIGCQQEVKGELIYFVRDNGVGFDMRHADALFGVFKRLHRAEEFEGTGIGLANVRRIINRHGGRTWAEAAVNAGATFYFTLAKPAED
jgi:signal transduction histidine kinase